MPRYKVTKRGTWAQEVYVTAPSKAEARRMVDHDIVDDAAAQASRKLKDPDAVVYKNARLTINDGLHWEVQELIPRAKRLTVKAREVALKEGMGG